MIKEMHADDGEDVEDDGQDYSQLAQRGQSVADDGQQVVHCGPHLRQLQHAELHSQM